MFYAGLDLAAKPTNPSGLAILQNTKDKPKLTSLTNAYSDEEIIEFLKDVDYLAIDAPIIKRAQNIINKLSKDIEVVKIDSRKSALLLGLNISRPLFNQPMIKRIIDHRHYGIANKLQFEALIAAYTGYLHYKKRVRVLNENGSRIFVPVSQNIKLAVFDMDGTLTKPTSSWEHIHRELGTWENGGQLYLKKFLTGELSYEEFAKLDTAEWKGLSYDAVNKIAQKVPYVPGAKQIMDHLVSLKIPVVVISGGLSIIADKITSDFSIKRVFANDLVVKDGIITGDVDIQVSFNGKLAIYKKLLKEYKLKPYQVMAVGDTFGDVPLFQNCGLAVAINPIKPEVSDFADYTVTSLDQIVTLLS